MQRATIITALSLMAGAGCAVLAFVYRQELAGERTAHAEALARIDRITRQEQEPPVAPAPVELVGVDSNLVADLQARVERQEAELEALRTAATGVVLSANAAQVPVPDVLAATNAPEPRRSWMEDLKANDPERYKEIMDRREQARQEARYDIAKKAAFFLQQPAESMSDAEAEEYARMMDLLTDSLKLTEQLDAGLEGEARRDIMHNLRDNMRELSPLLESERSKEFYQVGKDLGYTDADAQAFAQYLDEVVNLTSVSSIFRSAMRGMGGWGGGPPPGERTDRPSPP